MSNPTVQDWAKIVNQNSQSPGKLAEINVKLASYHAYLTGKYVQSKFNYAEFYSKWNKSEDGKKRSDKMIEMMFLMTDEGKEYTILKYEMRAYKILIESIKTASIASTVELKQSNI